MLIATDDQIIARYKSRCGSRNFSKVFYEILEWWDASQAICRLTLVLIVIQGQEFLSKILALQDRTVINKNIVILVEVSAVGKCIAASMLL